MSKKWNKFLKISKLLVILAFCIYVALSSKVEKVNSLENPIKNEIKEEIIDYNIEETEDETLPFMERKIIQKGINGLKVNYNGMDVIIQKPLKEIVMVGNKILSTFYGELTGYGPDCIGCSGRLACPLAPNIKEGEIFFNDSTYGKLRILASDSKYPCGTVIRITTDKLGDPILGIVMDRGGAVKGNIIDLLAETESAAISRTYNVKYELIRKGW